MRVEKQLSVFLDNKPGSLAAVCEDLTAHDINIEAITIANLVDHAVVRLIVSDPRAAEHLLGESGTLVIVHDVLAVELPDQPGAIERLARTLGRARVNIDYMYGSSRAAGHGPADGVPPRLRSRARQAHARQPRALPRRPQAPTTDLRRSALSGQSPGHAPPLISFRNAPTLSGASQWRGPISCATIVPLRSMTKVSG